MDDIYKKHGYSNRAEYLKSLAEKEGADLSAVIMLADLLGPSEDFDGLIVMVQDGVSAGLC